VNPSHPPDRLSDVECMNLVLNVLVGGVDTTQSQLAHAVRLFAGHPEQWALLAERPELVAAAVEEVVRYEPITPFTARLLHEDVEYRDVTFPEGTVVMVCAFTGNRDGVEGDPDSFDITAERGAKPLTFGAGIHYCLGANLARAELQEALTFLPPRMPGLELDGEPQLGSVHGIYGLDSLPIRWTSA
jgi:cytochrome P450